MEAVANPADILWNEAAQLGAAGKFTKWGPLDFRAGNMAYDPDIGYSLRAGGDLMLEYRINDKPEFVEPQSFTTTLVGHRAGFDAVCDRTTAVGEQAGAYMTGDHTGVTLVGYRAGYHGIGTRCTAVGRAAALNQSGADCTYVGFQAGRGASGAGNVGIGNYSLNGYLGASVGYEEIPWNYCVAIGHNTDINAHKAVSLGFETVVDHEDSIAIGYRTHTSAAAQVAIGARDLEIQDAVKGVVLKSPNGTRWRVKVSDAGALTVTAI